MTINLIHDGDHGGDDFITTMLFAAYPSLFDLQGVTTVLGNTNAAQAARNALKALALCQRAEIAVRSGAEKPWILPYQLGDDAFGSDGLGQVEMPEAGEARDQDAVAWIARKLAEAPAPLTLCVTGPATNIALLLQEYPECRSKIEKIVMMGGGVSIGGNIKPYAEFNFYMDPDAAHIVLNAGVPVVLHTLDTTQQTYYTKERQQQVRALAPSQLAVKIDAIMRITEALELKSFGVDGSFFHDEHVCGYLAMPDNYETKRVSAQVLCAPSSEAGRLVVTDDAQGPVMLVTRLVDGDRFFAFLLEGLRRVLSQQVSAAA